MRHTSQDRLHSLTADRTAHKGLVMSSSRNSTRAAKAFARATGGRHTEGLNLARTGAISPEFPVPDAATPEQRQLEARFLHAVAKITRDKQLDGALFGVTAVRPMPSSLLLMLHPTMQRRVITELLPRLNVEGLVAGLAGLRCAFDGGQLALCDAYTDARIVVASWDGALPRRARDADNATPLTGPLHGAEADEIRDWSAPWRSSSDGADRDSLFSQLLRRPRLLNAAGAAHGLANTFTHHRFDLVIEYCCGPATRTLIETLRVSGVTANGGRDREDAPDPRRFLTFDSAKFELRRATQCEMTSSIATEYLAGLRSMSADEYRTTL